MRNWELELSIQQAAILACGLPADSRTVKAITNQSIDIQTMLLAAIADSSALLVWSKTKDAQKGRQKNKPKSYLKLLTTKKKEKAERSFSSGEEFEAERRRLIEGK